MPTNSKVPIFPHHVFEKTSGKGRSDIVLTETEGDEYRACVGTRRRMVSVSSGKLSSSQHDDFQTFCDLVEDELRPFLYLDIHRYKLDMELFATGDGQAKTFQLQRTRTREGLAVTLPILCPNHDYPARYVPAASGVTPRRYWPRASEDGLLHIFVGSVNNEIEYSIDTSTPEKLDALRYGGLVTLNNAPPPGGEIRARGYFFHLMRFEGGSPNTVPLGGGSWAIEESISMIEPKNLPRELAAIRGEL